MLQQLGGAVYIDPSKQTVRDYLLDDWLPSRRPKSRRSGRGHRGQVGIGTWASYKQDVNAYVLPHVGAVKLQTLTPAHLERLYDWLEESGGRQGQGLSPKTVANVHGLLHKALEDAVKRGKVPRNVADAVEAPRASRSRPQVWSPDQLRRFLVHVRSDRVYAAWLLWATTGMRRGEVAGLIWSDLDLDAAHVSVEWTLGVVEAKPTWKRRPKSDAGERRMALDPATVAAVREHHSRQAEDRLMLGAAYQSVQSDWRGEQRKGLVFAWPDGSLIHPERFSKWFADHCVSAGLPRIRLHDLRHTYATVGLQNATGWHEVKVISKRLGHASIGITLDTYAHVLPSADEETANTLARAILGGSA